MKALSLCCFFAALVPLSAGTITIGTADAGSGNSFPFGNPSGPGTIFQEVYAPADFNSVGAIDIQSVHFFRTQFGSDSDTITDATYTFKLSYSANPVDGLDTSCFSCNVSGTQFTLGTYTINSSNDMISVNHLDFEQNVSDFFYDPANGPLLLEIDLAGIGNRGTSFLDAMNGDAGGVFSRSHDFGSGFAGYGLVTGFDYGTSVVPEPATVALIGGGLLALGFLRRRK